LTTTIVAAVVAGCVAGCGPPDRRADAQRLQHVMAALPGVSSAQVSSNRIADDAMRLREVASAISADQISWFRHDSNSVLDMRDVRTPTASLPALVAEGGSTDVKVSVGQGIPPPPWGVSFPFAPADQQHLEQRIGPLPVVVRAVGETGAATSNQLHYHRSLAPLGRQPKLRVCSRQNHFT
jgi:hypothetical protein